MPTGSTRKSEFAIPADLGPSEAHDMHRNLLAWLESGRGTGRVELSGDAGQATISALQMVIAATRSEIGNPPALGPSAERAVAALTATMVLEHVHT